MIVGLVLLLCTWCFNRCKAAAEWNNQDLFFSTMLEMAVDGFLELVLAIYINSIAASFETNGEVLNSICMAISIALVYIILPYALI